MRLAALDAFPALVQETLASGISVRFKAGGTSMHPAIRDGETIAAAPVAIRDVVRGDILLYRSRGRLLAHRVVAVIEREGVRTLRTRGDAKRGCDALVAPGDVIGRVTAVVRGPYTIRLDGRVARLRHRLWAAVVETRRRTRRALLRAGRHATISAA